MPICIHCRFPLATLYTTYSRADDRSLGKGVRLTQCPRCKRFADKYVEHDFVVLFIDLVLIKPQVYRHLLFNRLNGGVDVDSARTRERSEDVMRERTGWWKDWDPSIIRLGILLLLFDVYLTWARIEKSAPIVAFPTSSAPPSTLALPHANSLAINATDAIASLVKSPTLNERQGANFLASQSILNQYLFFLLLCASETVTFHGLVRYFCTRKWFLSGERKAASGHEDFLGSSRAERHGAISTGVSSAIPSRPPSRMHSARPSADDNPTISQAMPSPFPTTATSASSQPPHAASASPAAPTTKAASQPSTPSRSSNQPLTTPPIPPTITTTTISTALLVSSLPNLFPILMVIWAYDLPSSASAVSWAVIVNNIAALEILLDCGILRAAVVVGLGGMGRWCVGRGMLGMVGLGEGIVGELEIVVKGLRALLGVG